MPIEEALQILHTQRDRCAHGIPCEPDELDRCIELLEAIAAKQENE